MPELPEVQTTVNGLNKTVKNLSILDVWTDYKSAHKMHEDSIKNAVFFKQFKKRVIGKKILKAERRAKNVLIHLSDPSSDRASQDKLETILIHMKMTGHLLYGKYKKINNKQSSINKEFWEAEDKFLNDPFNRFIRFILVLNNNKHLAFSDMRRFGKVTLIPTKNLTSSSHLSNIGPEPLETGFKFESFKARVLKRPNGKVKQVLMDPSIIAGIGNIYSDEILWRANIHPVSSVKSIPEKNLKLAFTAMKEVLKKGIDFGGDSMSDYRNIKGEKGKFQDHHQAYRRTGKPCTKKGCKGVIKKTVVGGRSAHFCSVHQKLFQ